MKHQHRGDQTPQWAFRKKIVVFKNHSLGCPKLCFVSFSPYIASARITRKYLLDEGLVIKDQSLFDLLSILSPLSFSILSLARFTCVRVQTLLWVLWYIVLCECWVDAIPDPSFINANNLLREYQLGFHKGNYTAMVLIFLVDKKSLSTGPR